MIWATVTQITNTLSLEKLFTWDMCAFLHTYYTSIKRSHQTNKTLYSRAIQSHPLRIRSIHPSIKRISEAPSDSAPQSKVRPFLKWHSRPSHRPPFLLPCQDCAYSQRSIFTSPCLCPAAPRAWGAPAPVAWWNLHLTFAQLCSQHPL